MFYQKINYHVFKYFLDYPIISLVKATKLLTRVHPLFLSNLFGYFYQTDCGYGEDHYSKLHGWAGQSAIHRPQNGQETPRQLYREGRKRRHSREKKYLLFFVLFHSGLHAHLYYPLGLHTKRII